MAALLRNSARLSSVLSKGCLRPSCLLLRSTPIATSSLVRKEEDFWSKNSRLKRPMSPHLTIYSPQLTSMLSITHRGTGVAMTAVTASFALCALVLPENFEFYLNWVKTLEIPSWILFSGKTVLAWPLCYHAFNGIRHLGALKAHYVQALQSRTCQSCSNAIAIHLCNSCDIKFCDPCWNRWHSKGTLQSHKKQVLLQEATDEATPLEEHVTAWDLGYGFDMGVLYKSGWLVFFGSIGTAAALVYFLS